jgi:hypothetical protein
MVLHHPYLITNTTNLLLNFLNSNMAEAYNVKGLSTKHMKNKVVFLYTKQVSLSPYTSKYTICMYRSSLISFLLQVYFQ